MQRLLFVALTVFLAACGTSRQLPGAAVLRVMSYNIHIAVPPSKPGTTDIDAIVKAIAAQNPDLVALQEVDVNTRRTGNINEAEVIARKLNMNFHFAKAIDHDGGDYGVAILSRFPLSEMTTHRLTTIEGSGGEPRVLTTAKVALPGGKFLRFGSTHLDAQRAPVNREKQIAEINSIAEKESLPFIIAGDFNDTPGSAVINKLDQVFTRTCTDCPPTFPVVTPRTTIDFIAYKTGAAFEVVSHEVVNEHYASDHLPVMATLRYKID